MDGRTSGQHRQKTMNACFASYYSLLSENYNIAAVVPGVRSQSCNIIY